jgi:hypothetical protein
MSGKLQFDVFFQVLTEMVQAQRQQKGAQQRHQCRTYADRLQTRPEVGTSAAGRPSPGPDDGQDPRS